MKKYEYCSILKYLITGFIEEKRSLGFNYESEEYRLRKLDKLAVEENLSEIKITKEFADKFVAKNSYEKKITAINRIHVIRELAKYMIRKGYEAYLIPPLPRGSYNSDFAPYIFSDKEVQLLFKATDKWSVSKALDGRYYSQRKKYPVILRILYSTGMRISEVLSLQLKDIDFEKGTFTILNAKNHSERIIPIHENTLKILKNYINEEHICISDEYVFKGLSKKKHLAISSFEALFLDFLSLAGIAHTKEGPRVHSFRHTFCVHRLKLWVIEERNITALFPYLCAYMGHADTRSTEYYLRLTADLFPDIVLKTEKYLYGGKKDEE